MSPCHFTKSHIIPYLQWTMHLCNWIQDDKIFFHKYLVLYFLYQNTIIYTFHICTTIIRLYCISSHTGIQNHKIPFAISARFFWLLLVFSSSLSFELHEPHRNTLYLTKGKWFTSECRFLSLITLTLCGFCHNATVYHLSGWQQMWCGGQSLCFAHTLALPWINFVCFRNYKILKSWQTVVAFSPFQNYSLVSCNNEYIIVNTEFDRIKMTNEKVNVFYNKGRIRVIN